MTELSVESLRQPSGFCRALTESSTAEIWLGGTYDPRILRKIPPGKHSAANQGQAKAHWPLAREKKVRSLGIELALVTEHKAKAYAFNYNKWKRMMYAASSVDYK